MLCPHIKERTAHAPEQEVKQEQSGTKMQKASV